MPRSTNSTRAPPQNRHLSWLFIGFRKACLGVRLVSDCPRASSTISCSCGGYSRSSSSPRRCQATSRTQRRGAQPGTALHGETGLAPASGFGAAASGTCLTKPIRHSLWKACGDPGCKSRQSPQSPRLLMAGVPGTGQDETSWNAAAYRCLQSLRLLFSGSKDE